METSTKWVLGLAAVGVVGGGIYLATRKKPVPLAAAAPAPLPQDTDPLIHTSEQREYNEGKEVGKTEGPSANTLLVTANERNPYRSATALKRQAWLDGYEVGYRGGITFKDSMATASQWASKE